MSYAENKSLAEYGELESMHHTDAQAAREAGEEQARLNKVPAHLVVVQSVGGSYGVEWSKGNAEVPRECQGIFTGKLQAQNSIDVAMLRLTQEAEAREALEAAKATRAKAEARKAEEAAAAEAEKPKVTKKAAAKK